MWDISIQEPSPLPHNPHNPTTIAIPHRRTRCPGSYPLAIQQTGPDHHTGFIGPESQSKYQGVSASPHPHVCPEALGAG